MRATIRPPICDCMCVMYIWTSQTMSNEFCVLLFKKKTIWSFVPSLPLFQKPERAFISLLFRYFFVFKMFFCRKNGMAGMQSLILKKYDWVKCTTLQSQLVWPCFKKTLIKKNKEEKGLYWFCVYRKVNKLCKKCQQAHSTHIFLKKKE